MSALTPDQLKRLAAVGVTVDQLAVMVAVMEERDAVTAASRSVSCPIPPDKSKDAIRAKRYRDRKRETAAVTPSRPVTPTVTVDRDGGAIGGNLTLIPQEDSGKGKKEIQHARDRGTRLPEDWQPKAGHYDRARELGIADRFERHVEEFKNHWWSTPGARGRKVNWDMTFTNRLIQIAEFYGRRPNGTNQKPSMAESFQGAIDLLDAKRRRRGEGNGSGGGDLLKLPGLG